MKKLLLSLALAALSVLNSQAVVQVFNINSATPLGATNLFTLSSRINFITINTGSGTTATNLVYALTDSPTNAPALGWSTLALTNTAFTQVSQYLTNITKITTNFSGVTYTNTFTNAVYSYTNTAAANTNFWRRIASGTIVSNSTVTITGPFPVIYGLGLTNLNAGVVLSITVDYDPSL